MRPSLFWFVKRNLEKKFPALMILSRINLFATIFLLSLAMTIANSSHLSIRADETNFESVLNQSIVLISEDDNISTISVSSNIPLTMLQYREEYVAARLIPDNALQIYLKKKCNNTDSFETYNPAASISMRDEELIINLTGSSDGFLPSSSFDALWQEYDPSCSFGNSNIFWDLVCVILDPFTKIMRRVRPRKYSPYKKKLQTSGECIVVGEILYDACDVTLSVGAPSVQVFNEHYVKDVISDSNDCTITSSGVLHFEDEANATYEGAHSYVIPAVGRCDDLVVGRPYVDEKGNTITAEAFVMDPSIPQWSYFNEFDKNHEDTNNDHSAQVNDWTNRAIGEHSSIASFAAFTIALMTNGAPPDLIADSLQAAMDEFNHAQTSFEMASYLSQQNISPGPLPGTSHKFDQDLHQLAFGTAKEGCVDETISALLGAAEIVTMEEKKVDKPGNWKDKVIKISKEEANHSALAWRTLEWVCRKDQEICESIINYLRIDGHSRAVKRINMEGLNLDENIIKIVKYEWNRILQSLISQLGKNKMKSSTDLKFDQSKQNFIREIANEILNNFAKANEAFISVYDAVES